MYPYSRSVTIGLSSLRRSDSSTTATPVLRRVALIKMSSSLRLLVIAAAASMAVLAPNPGAEFAVSQKLLDYALGIAQQKLLPALTSITIPDISGRQADFDYKLTNGKIKTVSLANASIVFRPPGVFVSIPQLKLEVDGDWSFKQHHIQ